MMQAPMIHPISVGQQGRRHSARFSVIFLSLELLTLLFILLLTFFALIYEFHGSGIIPTIVVFGASVFMLYTSIRDFGTQVTLDGESIVKTTLFGVQTFKLTEVNTVSMEDYYLAMARLFADDGHVLTVQFEQMRRGGRFMAAIINQVRDARPDVQVSPRLLKLAARYVMEGRA